MSTVKQTSNLCECGCGGKTFRRFCPGHNVFVLKKTYSLCLCNCGKLTRKNYINGHKPKTLNLCGCGCGGLCRRLFLHGHSNRVSHPRGMKWKTSWIKGKTWEEVVGVERASQIKDRVRQANSGRKVSEKTKQLLSLGHIGNKNALGNHPVFPASWHESHRKGTTTGSKRPDTTERNKKLLLDGKIGWGVSRHTLGESYPEKLFRTFLERHGCLNGKEFIQELHVGTYWIDFAFPDLGIGLEIDGKQHNLLKMRERDSKRDIYLKEEGWHIFRLPVKELKLVLDQELLQQ